MVYITFTFIAIQCGTRSQWCSVGHYLRTNPASVIVAELNHVMRCIDGALIPAKVSATIVATVATITMLVSYYNTACCNHREALVCHLCPLWFLRFALIVLAVFKNKVNARQIILHVEQL